MKDDNCIFCKIANGEIPSATVYEDDDFRAILDLGPASNGHTLILPKNHYKDLCEADEAVMAKILPLAAKLGTSMKSQLGASGFNVVQNNGTSAGQTVFHLHVHVIPRYEGGPDMVNWAPGKPEQEELAQTAETLKAGVERTYNIKWAVKNVSFFTAIFANTIYQPLPSLHRTRSVPSRCSLHRTARSFP